MTSAYAHSDHVSPKQGAMPKWAWDPTLVFFILIAILYARGARKAPVARWKKVFFFCGIAALFLASLPPIDPLADQLFVAHMLQHLVITSVGVPLLIFGAP